MVCEGAGIFTVRSKTKFIFRDPLLGFKVVKSFGSMRIMFSYLTQIEVTHMQ